MEHTHLRGTSGWTVGYICMSERDRWTSHGMPHNPMGWYGHFTAFMDLYRNNFIKKKYAIHWLCLIYHSSYYFVIVAHAALHTSLVDVYNVLELIECQNCNVGTKG